MLNKVRNLILENKNVNYQDIIPDLFSNGFLKGIAIRLKDTDYYTAPASSCYHECYNGGLIEHSLRVCYWLFRLKDSFGISEEVSNDSLLMMGLYHDICKVGMYEEYKKNIKDENNNWIQVSAYKVNPDYVEIGHGDASFNRLLRLGINYNEFEEELLAIRLHMGSFDMTDYNKKFYNKACTKYPLILFLHTADNLAVTNLNI